MASDGDAAAGKKLEQATKSPAKDPERAGSETPAPDADDIHYTGEKVQHLDAQAPSSSKLWVGIVSVVLICAGVAYYVFVVSAGDVAQAKQGRETGSIVTQGSKDTSRWKEQQTRRATLSSTNGDEGADGKTAPVSSQVIDVPPPPVDWGGGGKDGGNVLDKTAKLNCLNCLFYS